MSTDTRTFYGPHACDTCGASIVRASTTEGGEKYDTPEAPIYPNTEWARHNCPPSPTSDPAMSAPNVGEASQ